MASNGMSKFQIGLLVIFGAFILLAVMLFSLKKGDSTTSANLTVWGSLSAVDWSAMLQGSGLSQSDVVSFRYVEKSPGKLAEEFTEALAEGKGPDLVILPIDELQSNKSKLMIIPAETVKTADFVNTFIKEGELFLDEGGVYAMPLFVDPMVLYWNRDLFDKAALATPPIYWDQIYDYVRKFTIKDNAGNVTQTALALGEYKNIPNAKEILALLMLQAGTPIVTPGGRSMRGALLDSIGGAQIPAVAALEFYTQFANPQKSFYSWNRSLLSADTHFTSGKSAMYLGFASEHPILRAKNPTLDLGVSPVPQSRVSGRAATFGKLYGVAVVRATRNPAGAIAGAVALVSKANVQALAANSPLIPARRDILGQIPSDPADNVFYAAALLSRGWLDPDPSETEVIFMNMVESVTSGRARVDGAVSTANSALNNLLRP